MNSTDSPNPGDVQGLIVQGYNFPNIRYIILSISDTAGARKFLADMVPGAGAGPLVVTAAVPWPHGRKPPYCLNVGLTYSGLQILIGQTNCTVVGNDSPSLFASYQTGAVADSTSMGDTYASDPVNWWKNTGWLPDSPPRADGSDLHIQLTLFAQSPETRETYYNTLLGMIPNSANGGGPSVVPVFFKDSDDIVIDGDPGYIHFGYRDSLSQPRIDYPMPGLKKSRSLAFNPAVDDRPPVPSDRFIIKSASDTGDYFAHPLLVNGSFAAFRLLYQDVEKFTEFINSDKDIPAELLAAKMCGRWRNGVPLVISPDTEKIDLGQPGPRNFNFTNFDYLSPSPNQPGDQSPDPDGAKCPFAAHIRRANPRDDSNVTQNVDNAQVNRIVRRASPYGPKYEPGENPRLQRGLVGLFISAVLDNGFRFVTQTWFNQPGFNQIDNSPNFSGIDPLFGPQPSDSFQGDHEFYFLENGQYVSPPVTLSRFIRTDGSLYIFLPGITALKYISQGMIPPLTPKQLQ